MITSNALVVTLGVLASLCTTTADSNVFPDDFLFGASTSAFQVEGAWNVSGKGESILEHYMHTVGTFNRSVEGGNGEIACNSYNLWERDVEMISYLGLNHYRFSISWSRLLPSGFTNSTNQEAVEYYNNLIDALIAEGVIPLVTIHHFDLPQRLQNLGGWTNPLMVDWFAEYATVVFNLFADRVTRWLTINEPAIMCDLAYELGRAPGIVDAEIGSFLCSKHALLGHAKAYRIYDTLFKPTYNGSVSLSQGISWYEPYSSDDQNVTELAREFFIGRYIHPIVSDEGGWPAIVEKYMCELSTKEGYSWSRLPTLSTEEIALIKGTYDFFAFNHYTSRLVRAAEDGEEIETTPNTGIKEFDVAFVTNSTWTYGANPSFAIYPEGLRKLLAWLKDYCGDVEFLITENGYSTTAAKPNDDARISFIQSFLKQILLSIYEDEVNVIGYTVWSLMDNIRLFTGSGLPFRFGLYEVDFSSSNLTRTPRGSAEYYKGIIQNRTLA